MLKYHIFIIQSTWSWTDGWPVMFTNWADADNNTETCASLTLRDGKWRPVSCDQSLRFVCKYNPAPLPTTPPPGDCPAPWEDIGTDKCYLFFETTYVTWDEGRTMCWSEAGADGHHADMVSIHSQDEAEKLSIRMKDMISTWIGILINFPLFFGNFSGSVYAS